MLGLEGLGVTWDRAGALNGLGVAAWYGMWSLVALGAYGQDKGAARRGDRRTAETRLILLGWLGGWPGAWLAQRYFHHKTRKPGFQARFWLSVAGHGLGWAAWFLWRR